MSENTHRYFIHNKTDSYHAFGDTMLDAINRFDKFIRERNHNYVSNVVLDEAECMITVVGLDKDSIGFSIYKIEEKE